MTAVREYRHEDLDPGLQVWLAIAGDLMDEDRDAGIDMMVGYIANAIVAARNAEAPR